MKKLLKLFTFIAFMILILGGSRVQAATHNTPLDDIIKVKVDEEWENLKIYKYTDDDNDLIYKQGKEDVQITEDISKDLRNYTYDTKLYNIFRKVYKNNNTLEELGVASESDDLYIATKIAIDCVENDIQVSDIRENYQVIDNADEAQIKRAESIISAAEKLVNEGYNGKFIPKEVVYVERIGKLTEDEVNNEYYSQKYSVKMKYKDTPITSYTKNPNTDDSSGLNGYYVAKVNEGTSNTEFTGEDTEFKIMIPRKHYDEPFKLQVDFNVKFQMDMIYQDKGYYLYGIGTNETGFLINYNNAKSILDLSFVDADTEKIVHGCVISTDGGNLVQKSSGIINIKNLGRGTFRASIVSVPDVYYYDNANIEIEIPYDETVKEEVSLKRKKGNLTVTNETAKATYEIYDSNFEKAGEYEADDDGSINVQNLRTGKYILKQKNVDGDFELATNQIFDITFNNTTYLTVTNEPKTPIEQDDEGGDRDESDDRNNQAGNTEDRQDDSTQDQGTGSEDNQHTPDANPSQPHPGGYTASGADTAPAPTPDSADTDTNTAPSDGAGDTADSDSAGDSTDTDAPPTPDDTDTADGDGTSTAPDSTQDTDGTTDTTDSDSGSTDATTDTTPADDNQTDAGTNNDSDADSNNTDAETTQEQTQNNTETETKTNDNTETETAPDPASFVEGKGTYKGTLPKTGDNFANIITKLIVVNLAIISITLFTYLKYKKYTD